MDDWFDELEWKVEVHAIGIMVQVAPVTAQRAQEILMFEGVGTWLPREGSERWILSCSKGKVCLRRHQGEFQFVLVRGG